MLVLGGILYSGKLPWRIEVVQLQSQHLQVKSAGLTVDIKVITPPVNLNADSTTP